MNDMSPWETQLESWTPRRPSARLKEQLFGKESQAQAPVRSAKTPLVLAWLAPASCMLVLAMSLQVWSSRPGEPSYLSRMGSSNMIASLSLPPSLAADYEPDKNVWTIATSAGGMGQSLTSTSSFSLLKTNLHF